MEISSLTKYWTLIYSIIREFGRSQAAYPARRCGQYPVELYYSELGLDSFSSNFQKRPFTNGAVRAIIRPLRSGWITPRTRYQVTEMARMGLQDHSGGDNNWQSSRISQILIDEDRRL
jgi:hypothetical protein